MQGKVVYIESITENLSEYRSEIQLGNLTRGIYLLKIEDSKSSIQEKIIIQR